MIYCQLLSTLDEDGTTVVTYGGQLRNDTLLGEIWILDVPTATWSQGPSGPIRASAACTIAGDQFIIWGGRRGAIVNAVPEMMIYNITSANYITDYTPPAFYKDLKPPPPLTRTTAPWPTGETTDTATTTGGFVAGCVVGGLTATGAIVGLVVYWMRMQGYGQAQNRRGFKCAIIKNSSRMARLLIPGQKREQGPEGEGDYGQRLKNNPQETIDELMLQQTLRELEAEEKELEEQQKEIDQKRQLLVLQHKVTCSSAPSAVKRGPTAFIFDVTEVISTPTTLPQFSPETLYSTSFPPESFKDRRTVQAAPVDMYQGDSYVEVGPRRESELAQDVIEPVYEPSPRVNSAIPELVYEASLNVGMDWTKQQRCNHPHTVVDPEYPDN
jgi:hypothetical protein